MIKIMFSKFLLVSTLFLIMAGSVACSNSPDPEKEAKRRVTFDDVENEPPFTEDEILLYIKILPEFAEIETDPAAEADFYKKYDLSKNRFFYLQGKIAIASLIVVGLDAHLDSKPKSLQPSEKEVEIVRKYFDELKAATDYYTSTVRNR